MRVITDRIAAAGRFLSGSVDWTPGLPTDVPPSIRDLSREIHGPAAVFHADAGTMEPWRWLLISAEAERSQMDVLAGFCRRYGEDLPGGLICLAESGRGFHGFGNRAWAAEAGNLHLSAFVSPRVPLRDAGVGFIVVSAVSVAEAIRNLSKGRIEARYKWVNDVLVLGRKVAGVLSRMQIQGDTVHGAILGIGLNVETKPHVRRDAYVPSVAALSEFFPCNRAEALSALITALGRNLDILASGGASSLYTAYRAGSVVLGKRVQIRYDSADEKEDRILAEGRVLDIGPDLELYLDTSAEPVRRGRLLLMEPRNENPPKET